MPAAKIRPGPEALEPLQVARGSQTQCLRFTNHQNMNPWTPGVREPAQASTIPQRHFETSAHLCRFRGNHGPIAQLSKHRPCATRGAPSPPGLSRSQRPLRRRRCHLPRHGNHERWRKAENFTDEEFAHACRAAHLAGARVYVTTNIVIKDDEMDRSGRAHHVGARHSAPRFIIQDWGLFSEIKRLMPEIETHISPRQTSATRTRGPHGASA